MKVVKLGVVGCGVIGRIHLEYAAKSPFNELMAVADMNEKCGFVQTGALGKLRLIRSRNINPVPPFTRTKPVWAFSKKINGGGNLGVYDLEYMFGLFDWSLRPEYVLAQAWNIPDRYQYQLEAECDGEIHVAAMIGCEGGIAFQLERGTLVSGQKQSAWEICGEHGTLYLNMNPLENKQILFDEATEKGIVTRIIWEGAETKDMRDGGPVIDFASAILNKIQPKTSLEQALISQQVIDAIYTSSESNQPVMIK